MDKSYNSDFFKTDCGLDYRQSDHWNEFFGNIADRIVELFNPQTVLDAGCAFGYLVKALRDRGVDAYGFDISEYAISMSDPSIKDYVEVHSITEPLTDKFPKSFDLIITIEVLEHMFQEESEKAIANLCNYSETIIFTSTPNDIDNRTHYNVRLAEYWAKAFADNSFYHDLVQDISFITPYAMLFRKRDSFPEVVFDYELNRRIDRLENDKIIEKIKSDAKESIAKVNENIAVIYYSESNSFSENNKITAAYNGSHISCEKVCLPAGTKFIRFDPIDDKPCIVMNLFAATDNGMLKFTPENASYSVNGIDFFEKSDCRYIASADEEIRWISMECAVICLDSVVGTEALEEIISEISALRDNNAELEKCVSEKECECEEIRAEMSEKMQDIIDESDRIVLEKEDCESELKKTSDELAHYKEHYTAAIGQREELKRQLSEANNRFACAINSYNMIKSSFFWRLTFPARKILDGIKWLFVRNRFSSLIIKGFSSLAHDGFRATWLKVKLKAYSSARIRHYAASTAELSKRDREIQEQTVFDRNIKFSVLVPLYNTPLNFLEEMIGSVIAQTYGNWELCLADGSDAKHGDVGKEVKKIMKNEPRIRYVKLEKNMGISENTNACIDMSTGDYIALFDHDDIMHPSALFEVMKAICEKDADFVYTDEATFLSPNIKHIVTAHFKPDFAIDNLRANNYICHLSVFSREVLDKAGKFRSEYDGSQDHDMILRLTANAKNIAHIPKILYFWRSHPASVSQDINSKTYAIEAGKKAVKTAIEGAGYNVEVTSSQAFPTIYHLKYEIKSYDKVSIIIPNKNHLADLKKCINSILEKTTYPDYEIIIVDNGSDERALFEYYDRLKKDKRFVICSLDIEFNYSRLNNFGAEHASGKYYILLNNDIEIITPEWIEEMLMYVQREDVGICGAKLYYPDDTIQHAGIILGLGADRVAGHAFHRYLRTDIGYMGRLCYANNLSAVTAACMMVKASVYKEVGGLDESFRVAYNDVDFCLKIRKKGYLIVWTPYCEAYHYESLTRGYENTPEKQVRFKREQELFKRKWADFLEKGDPYYNPNLTLDRADFSLK